MAKESSRMSAEERRESVVRAAIVEFARGGYAGTSTAAIARRVGVSQPYLFRLFPDKREIFLAAAERCTQDIRRVFDEAARKVDLSEILEVKEAMADAYLDLVEDRDGLLFQLQMYVAVQIAEASGDAEFGERIRAAWLELYDSARMHLGADDELIGTFFSVGMLINVLVAMGFPPEHRVWNICPGMHDA
ncbi:TetR/AcrR family transcriptional regulator [Streptomyces sp. PT12]|uniref:TetR/AcrR family transcriptional regulator n=1 Tax=Streptomyces sp. PT12 TaxID=1510197 RepID=UPI00215D0EB2|nr:TetR/AcrR family transcriptional regulator [Streptomyces sp. PT12]